MKKAHILGIVFSLHGSLVFSFSYDIRAAKSLPPSDFSHLYVSQLFVGLWPRGWVVLRISVKGDFFFFGGGNNRCETKLKVCIDESAYRFEVGTAQVLK